MTVYTIATIVIKFHVLYIYNWYFNKSKMNIHNFVSITAY